MSDRLLNVINEGLAMKLRAEEANSASRVAGPSELQPREARCAVSQGSGAAAEYADVSGSMEITLTGNRLALLRAALSPAKRIRLVFGSAKISVNTSPQQNNKT